MGQVSKIILESLLVMSDMFSQRFSEELIKVMHVHHGKYVKFRQL